MDIKGLHESCLCCNAPSPMCTCGQVCVPEIALPLLLPFSCAGCRWSVSFGRPHDAAGQRGAGQTQLCLGGAAECCGGTLPLQSSTVASRAWSAPLPLLHRSASTLSTDPSGPRSPTRPPPHPEHAAGPLSSEGPAEKVQREYWTVCGTMQASLPAQMEFLASILRCCKHVNPLLQREQ